MAEKTILLSGNLKRLRKAMGYSQAQIADKVGLKRAAYGAYEEGRNLPPLSTLLVLCNLYSVSIDDMVYHEINVSITFQPHT